MVRDILITPVLNGWVCRVGCQTVIFENLESMGEAVKRYYRDPEIVEKSYVADAKNKTMDRCVPEPCNQRSEPCQPPDCQPAQSMAQGLVR